MNKFITEYRQLAITIALAILILLTFGIIQLINYDGDTTSAERYKHRADRHFSSGDYVNAVNLYNIALEADPAFEEVYIILHDYYIGIDESVKAWDVINQAVLHTDSDTIRTLYTNADYPIEFNDEFTERFVRGLAQKDNGVVWRSDLDGVTSFAVGNAQVQGLGAGFYRTFHSANGQTSSVTHTGDVSFTDLNFLKHFRKLESLLIQNISLEDWAVLSELTNLSQITILFDALESENWLYSQSSLTLPPLSRMTGLNYLEIQHFEIYNLSALAGLTGLGNLTLHCLAEPDLSALETLTELRVLNLCTCNYDGEVDFSPLRALVNLEYLELTTHATSADLSFLDTLPNLKTKKILISGD